MVVCIGKYLLFPTWKCCQLLVSKMNEKVKWGRELPYYNLLFQAIYLLRRQKPLQGKMKRETTFFLPRNLTFLTISDSSILIKSLYHILFYFLLLCFGGTYDYELSPVYYTIFQKYISKKLIRWCFFLLILNPILTYFIVAPHMLQVASRLQTPPVNHHIRFYDIE